MKVMIFLVLALMVACSTPHQLNDQAKKIEVYTSAPKDCVVVGKVKGLHKEGSMDLARNQAINAAANLGANGVVINQEIPNGMKNEVFATAYQCE
ncbi:MAG: hypothetical protein ACOVP4_00690 [Bacteriovoracaceae bacterium]|jgi:hypothetical protein